MDKAYILNNGILEEYLLGELALADQLLVESILESDIELRAQFETLEASFKALAFENAIKPPKEVKEKLMLSLNTSHPKVLHLQKPNPFKNYLGIAASIAVILLGATAYLYSELNSVKSQLELANQDNSRLNGDLVETNRWYTAINDPDVQKYVMQGNSLSPNARVISYVNHTIKSVFVNTENLPSLDDEHDYQMWADVRGKMINMGVIKKENKMLAMNYIDDSESLNITIEPLGGSDHPNVAQLVTNVYLR